MRRSFLAAAIVPVVAFAAVTFGSAKEAAAGPTVDLDLNLGTALQTNRVGAQSQVDFSLGGGAAVGYRWNIPRSYVYVQPEIGGHYMRFGFNSTSLGGFDYAGTLNGGLRAGLQGIVQPNIFGHLGFGFLGRNLGPSVSEGVLGPAMDIGLGLDIRPVPGFTIGAQIAYNSVIVPSATYDAAKWVSFGLKVGFQFGEPRPRPVYYRTRPRY